MPHKDPEVQKHRYRTIPKVFFARLYQNQKNSSKRRGHPMPDYTLEELIEWLKNQPTLTEIWQDYQDSNHARKSAPSLDRLDDSKPYTLDNIRLTTWHINMTKAKQHTREGLLNTNSITSSKKIQRLSMDGDVIDTFNSSGEAAEILAPHNKYARSNIRAAATGKIPSAYGYQWKDIP